eukprot:13844300-Ditylum_brightwellii.AAC.1
MPYKADGMKARCNSNRTWWWMTWPHWLSHGSSIIHNIVSNGVSSTNLALLHTSRDSHSSRERRG